EPRADSRQPLAARRHELRLAQREVGSGAQLVARATRPEGAVRTTLHVHELVQPRPLSGPDALRAVTRRQRADRATRGIEPHVEPTGLPLERGPPAPAPTRASPPS